MTSTSHLKQSSSERTAAGDTAVAEADRWRFKPPASAPTGFVDGAWWPRSTDLAAEVPALLAAVAARLGRVERVSYRIGDWAPVARKIVVDGAVVRLGGFRSRPADTVDLVSRTQRLSVLVIPPSTDPSVAEQALAEAAGSENVDTASALLAASSRPAGDG